LITEFEVQRRVRAILASAATPMRRVRALVRLAARIRQQAGGLLVARDVSSRTREPNGFSCLDRLVKSSRMLYDEVRLAAWNLLNQARGAVVAT